MPERESFHRKLGAEVKEHLKTADQLSSAVLSPEEFHNLRKRCDALKNEYNDDSVRLEKVLNRLTAASKLKDQFDTQAVAFRKWMERTNGSLDRMLTSTTESSTIAACQKQCQELNDDVSGHRSELDSISNLAQQIQDEVKGYATQLTEDESIVANIPALTAVKSELEGLVSSWQILKNRCQFSHHQIEDAKSFFIFYGQLRSWLSFVSKLIAVIGPVGVDTRLIDNHQQQIQVLLDECEGQKPTLDEFVRYGNSLLVVQTNRESKQPISGKIDEISEKWTTLINRLNEKKTGLTAESKIAAKFRRHQSEFKANLDKANNRFEKFLAAASTTTNANESQLSVICKDHCQEMAKNASGIKDWMFPVVGIGVCVMLQGFVAITSFAFGSFSVDDLKDFLAKLEPTALMHGRIEWILWFVKWPYSTGITLASSDLIHTGSLVISTDVAIGGSNLTTLEKQLISVVLALSTNAILCKITPALLQWSVELGLKVGHVCSLILAALQLANVFFYIGWAFECAQRKWWPAKRRRGSSRDIVNAAVRLLCVSDRSDCDEHPMKFANQRVLMGSLALTSTNASALKREQTKDENLVGLPTVKSTTNGGKVLETMCRKTALGTDILAPTTATQIPRGCHREPDRICRIYRCVRRILAVPRSRLDKNLRHRQQRARVWTKDNKGKFKKASSTSQNQENDDSDAFGKCGRLVGRFVDGDEYGKRWRSSSGGVDKQLICRLITDLTNPKSRKTALFELSKKCEVVPDLAVMLWHSFGTVAAFLQEIISIYPAINPPTLTAQQSNCVCKCIASHGETRGPFLQAHIPLSLDCPVVPSFLHTTSKTRPFEYLRLTSLGVIGALVKTDAQELITFLLTTEIIPSLRSFCRRSYWTKLVSPIYCQTHDRFSHVAMILGKMVITMAKEPSTRLLKHVIRCYSPLSDNTRAREALRQRLPDQLRDATFGNASKDNSNRRTLVATFGAQFGQYAVASRHVTFWNVGGRRRVVAKTIVVSCM